MTEQIKEIADRCRRMETRLTKFLEQQGFDTRVKRPEWSKGTVEVPSDSCSIKDILSVVPDNWDRDKEIIVIHKGKEVMALYLPDK